MKTALSLSRRSGLCLKVRRAPPPNVIENIPSSYETLVTGSWNAFSGSYYSETSGASRKFQFTLTAPGKIALVIPSWGDAGIHTWSLDGGAPINYSGQPSGGGGTLATGFETSLLSAGIHNVLITRVENKPIYVKRWEVRY